MAGNVVSGSSNSDDMIVNINVTPLVDVVLVLLVIFMITAPALYQQAIHVDLPKAVSGEATKHVTLKFMIQKEGQIYLDKTAVKREQIPELIQKALKDDPAANSVISADAAVSHGNVVMLIDQMKQNGISRVAIGVDNPSAVPTSGTPSSSKK